MNKLWDFDGTLFNTYPAYTNALSSVLGDEIDKKDIYKNLKISYVYAIKYYNVSLENEAEVKVLLRSYSQRI